MNMVDPTGEYGFPVHGPGLFLTKVARAFGRSTDVTVAVGVGAKIGAGVPGAKIEIGAEVTSGYRFSQDASKTGQIANATAGAKADGSTVELQASVGEMKTETIGGNSVSTENGPKLSGQIKAGGASTGGKGNVKLGVTAGVVKLEAEVDVKKFSEDFNKL